MTLGVGIAGAGWFAGLHARAIAATPGLHLVASAAGSPASAARFAAEHGGRAVADWRELLDDPAIAVLLIASPHHLHAPMAIAAAQAGRHVLVEKPMAPDLASCIAMHRAARAGGVALMVAHVMRFVAPCLAAKELLATGRLGPPRIGRSAMTKRWMEHNRRPWHLMAETGGGMLLTAGIHALDRLVWLMDSPPTHVSAIASTLWHADQPVPDVDLALLRFASGAAATLTSAGTRDTTVTNDAEIICENGILRMDMQGNLTLGQGGQWHPQPHASEPDWLMRGLEREWQAMLAAIHGSAPPPVGAAEAGLLIATIEAATRAAAEHREIPIPPFPAD